MAQSSRLTLSPRNEGQAAAQWRCPPLAQLTALERVLRLEGLRVDPRDLDLDRELALRGLQAAGDGGAHLALEVRRAAAGGRLDLVPRCVLPGQVGEHRLAGDRRTPLGSSSTWTWRWPPSLTSSMVTVAPLRTSRPSSNTTVRVQREVAPTLNLTFWQVSAPGASCGVLLLQQRVGPRCHRLAVEVLRGRGDPDFGATAGDHHGHTSDQPQDRGRPHRSISSTHAGTVSVAGPWRTCAKSLTAIGREVQLEGVGAVADGVVHEGGRGVDDAGGADGDEQVAVEEGLRARRPCRRASPRTRPRRAAGSR